MADVQQQAGGAVLAAVSKGASAATVGSVGGALFFGISADVLGVLVAGCVGLIGIAVKAAIDIHFKNKHLAMLAARLAPVVVEEEEEDES